MAPGSETKHLILGTAGHVDHGKTTLIKAMTGINTDRLKEEQERGLTIDLGFAHLRLPSGRQVGIVDVPGHEKFLKNMLAGASGVDIALLVVAADEGVMPQTTEHLEILELLETRQGVVALTKSDMVEEEWLEIVEDDLSRALASTFLREAKIVRVSGTTGVGIDELVREIDRLAGAAVQRSSEGPFRLPVDRVFTMTGFGTVVTGTLVSGAVKVGDPVTVLPQGMETRVRQLQVHGRKQDAALAGSRVAVNLVGVDVGDLERGSVLLPPGYLQATTSLDASVTVLADSPRPLRSRTRIRLHIGTAEAIGRAMVLGAEEIGPGSKGLVQLRLESPVVAARGDRFVLRFYSPTRVLGGGVILDPLGTKHKRSDSAVLDRLRRALKGDPEDIALDALSVCEAGLVKSEIARKTGLAGGEVDSALNGLAREERIVEYAGRFLARTAYEGIAARVRSTLSSYHEVNPMRAGMPKEELRAQLGSRIDQKGFQAILALMAAGGEAIASEATVRLSGHQPTLDQRQERIASGIESDYLESGVNPPLAPEIERKYGAESRAILALMVERGTLVKIAQDIYMHRDALRCTEDALRGYLQSNGQMTVAQFRDLVGSSRKYAVPLLEYFDTKRVTRRLGDQRVLFRQDAG